MDLFIVVALLLIVAGQVAIVYAVFGVAKEVRSVSEISQHIAGMAERTEQMTIRVLQQFPHET